MKRILLAALLFSGYASVAQELAYKIPKDAMAVVSVKGDKLLELMSSTDFNNSVLGRKILEKISDHSRDRNYTGIEEFGLKLNGTVYYFNQQTDSISYHCLLLPLADAARFEQLFAKRDLDKIERSGDTRQLYNAGDNALLQWNNEFALFVSGDLKDDFMEHDSVMAERYGLKNISYSDYYYNGATEAATDYAVAAPVAEAAPVIVEGSSDPEAIDPGVPTIAVGEGVKEEELLDGNDRGIKTAIVDGSYPDGVAPPAEEEPLEKEAMVEEAPPAAVVEMSPPSIAYSVEAPPVPVSSRYDESGYEKAYNEQRSVKRKLTASWVKHFAGEQFRANSHQGSILENPAYQRSQDNHAAATLYLANMQSLYQGLVPYYSKAYFGHALEGYGSINARLFLEQNQMRVTSEMMVDDAKAASYKKMYHHKPNKKFAKYINSDKMVGFISYSFDTEEYLKELPHLLDQSYGRYLGLYNDEIGMSAELFSLLLDEKAVAKVIKGDAVLLLNDVGQKDYTYTTYEYDDDYKRTEVKKTKTETLPDFLFMMSSDDTHLLERLLQYGIRKQKITLKNGIYTLDNSISKHNPFSVHILIKDGIIFCGTSYRDIQQISADNYPGNMDKQQKDLLLKNNMAFFFNPKNIVGKITEKEFGSSRRLRDFNTLMGTTGKIYMRTNGVQDNLISGEIVAEVPEGNENSLKYFFSLIERASRLD